MDELNDFPTLGTIAVIEDDSAIRTLVTSVLEESGYDVISFDDTQPALDSIDFNEVDLVVTDLAMPTRGEKAIQAIKKNGHTLPIIVLSGVIGPGDKEKLEALGVDRVLEKPFNVQEVIDSVNELLPA